MTAFLSDMSCVFLCSSFQNAQEKKYIIFLPKYFAIAGDI